MSVQMEAIYENGVFRPLQPVTLAEHQRVTVITGAETSSTGLPFQTDPSPLRVDEGGAVRVGRSRIRLGLVVEQYENGMTPEDMVRAYDALLLADVHAVIAYYLRHRDEVRAYLMRRGEEADALRAKIEAERPRISRQELLARRNALEKADAPAGQ
jgi:uncharacterized protein (DUF433 family)